MCYERAFGVDVVRDCGVLVVPGEIGEDWLNVFWFDVEVVLRAQIL